MLEFLAVRMLTKKGESPILCLVGPPNRKDFVAKSIARAMNKKYVRISLGGVRMKRKTGAQAHMCVGLAGKDCEWNEGGGGEKPADASG